MTDDQNPTLSIKEQENLELQAAISSLKQTEKKSKPIPINHHSKLFRELLKENAKRHSANNSLFKDDEEEYKGNPRYKDDDEGDGDGGGGGGDEYNDEEYGYGYNNDGGDYDEEYEGGKTDKYEGDDEEYVSFKDRIGRITVSADIETNRRALFKDLREQLSHNVVTFKIGDSGVDTTVYIQYIVNEYIKNYINIIKSDEQYGRLLLLLPLDIFKRYLFDTSNPSLNSIELLMFHILNPKNRESLLQSYIPDTIKDKIINEEQPDTVKTSITIVDEKLTFPHDKDFSYNARRVRSGNKSTDCHIIHKNAEWISNPSKVVPVVWIHSNQNIDKYIYENSQNEDQDGNSWYKANFNYFDLQCDINRHSRSQDGYNLTCLNNDKIPIVMNVIYQFGDKSYAQDEELFKQQLDYFKNKESSNKTILRELLKNKLTDKFEHGTSILTDYLGGGEIDDKYIKELELLIFMKSDTVGDYLSHIIDIIIYVKLWENSVFVERLKYGYYTPINLVNLTPKEKIPEYFDKYNDDAMLRTIIEESKVHELELIYSMYLNTGKYIFSQYTHSYSNFVFDNSKRKEFMQSQRDTNKEYTDIQYTDIVGYSEGNSKFFFLLQDLVSQFENNDYINTTSRRDFTTEFVDMINRMTPSKRKQTIETETETETGFDSEIYVYESKGLNILYKDFFEIINTDIEKMENKLNGTITTTHICKYCKSKINGEGIKSLDGMETVHFCNITCMGEDAAADLSDTDT
jgi:hypothetical protein